MPCIKKRKKTRKRKRGKIKSTPLLMQIQCHFFTCDVQANYLMTCILLFNFIVNEGFTDGETIPEIRNILHDELDFIGFFFILFSFAQTFLLIIGLLDIHFKLTLIVEASVFCIS